MKWHMNEAFNNFLDISGKDENNFKMSINPLPMNTSDRVKVK